MSSFEEAKALISDFNIKLKEFNEMKKTLAKNIADNFSKVVEGYLKEYDIPYVFIKGTHPWNDGDTTYFTFNASYGYDEFDDDGMAYVVEVLNDYFPNADFSNLLDWDASVSNLVKDLSSLSDLTHEAFGEAWCIHAAFDKNGVFHYNFGECHDEY